MITEGVTRTNVKPQQGSVRPAPPPAMRGDIAQAETLLRDLATALDNAFISSWQSTYKWQKELDAALEYLRSRNADKEKP